MYVSTCDVIVYTEVPNESKFIKRKIYFLQQRWFLTRATKRWDKLALVELIWLLIQLTHHFIFAVQSVPLIC